MSYELDESDRVVLQAIVKAGSRGVSTKKINALGMGHAQGARRVRTRGASVQRLRAAGYVRLNTDGYLVATAKGERAL